MNKIKRGTYIVSYIFPNHNISFGFGSFDMIIRNSISLDEFKKEIDEYVHKENKIVKEDIVILAVSKII